MDIYKYGYVYICIAIYMYMYVYLCKVSHMCTYVCCFTYSKTIGSGGRFGRALVSHVGDHRLEPSVDP